MKEREHVIARTVFVVSVGVTGALYALPQLRALAYPLLLLSTLVHELGHGLAAVLVGAPFASFELWPDGSGMAQTGRGGSRLASAFIAAGGLVGPAIAAALSFLAGRRAGSARLFLGILCLGLVAALVFVVRNLFGFIFIGAFALLLALLVVRSGKRAPQVVLVFLGTQLGLSVYARGDYLFSDVAQTSQGPMPSDVAAIAEALLLPYWIWGALCGAVSVAALLVGAWALWQKD
jgi:hypothetical protein